MSKYSNAPDIATQHTEGFECGYDVNDNLQELSDNEKTLYEDEPQQNVEHEIVDSLDDSIYDAPASNHVTFADEQEPEKFSVGGIMSSVKEYANRALSFLKNNWLLLLVLAIALYVGYMWYYGKISFGRSSAQSGSFNLNDMSKSSSFVGSSSLGSAIRNMK